MPKEKREMTIGLLENGNFQLGQLYYYMVYSVSLDIWITGRSFRISGADMGKEGWIWSGVHGVCVMER